jgi:hypothetical protein
MVGWTGFFDHFEYFKDVSKKGKIALVLRYEKTITWQKQCA